MPTRADWEAASPKCPQITTRAAADGRIVVGKAATRCALPLHFDVGRAAWVCREHGTVVSGSLAAAQRAAAEAGEAAA